MTIFDVRIPGLAMTVVQADGNDVDPITVDEFRISVAETYDVIVQPHTDAAFTIFCPYGRPHWLRARHPRASPRHERSHSPDGPSSKALTMMDMGMGTMPSGQTSSKNMGEKPAVNISSGYHAGLSAPPAIKVQESASRRHGRYGLSMGYVRVMLGTMAMDAKPQSPLTPSLDNLPAPKVTYLTMHLSCNRDPTPL